MRIQGLSSIRTGQRVSLPGTSFPQIVRRRAPVDATKVAVRRADGTILTLGDLPAPDIRWTNHRKRLVLDSIDLGLLAPAIARTRYGLTEEELGEWRAMAGSGQTPEIWRERPIGAQGCGPVVAAGLEVDVAAGRLTVAGEEVHLSEAEWAILGALVEAESDWHAHAGQQTMPMPRITADMTAPPAGRAPARAWVETLF